MNRPILVMAGGTGGHVFPALAVAERLRDGGWPVVWLGTRAGIESRVVPAAGFDVEWIGVAGLRGKGAAATFLAPFHIARALWQSLRVVLRRRPAAVLGLGGYVSGPGALAARLTGRPLVIHEQNAVAGLTNRVLARVATRVLTGFPAVLTRGEWVGNPVRDSIHALPPPAARLSSRDGALRVLVLGGSQGARALNTVVPAAAALLDGRVVVRHQCGPRLVDEARDAWRAVGIAVEPEPFIDDIADAYGWADVVVCRAGALTIAELAAAGVGALLVPLPTAVDDHQTANARFLEAVGAAVLLPQPSLTPAALAGALAELCDDRARAIAMAEAARSVARPDAARVVADACVAAAEGPR